MVMRSHPKECYSILMEAAADALRTLAKDPKYIGSSKLSMMAVLHTWGRDLSYNPHVHFVAAGGALSEDGTRWLPSSANYLVPVFALSMIYRAKVREALKEAGILDMFPVAVWQEEWVVHSKAVGDGQAAMKYLAPYIFRVAISDSRIRSIEPGADGQGSVIYEYRPVGSRQSKTMPVSAEEFIRRFLQHVLPCGFRKVRHYGLASARSEMDVELLKWLVTITLQMVYVITVCARPMIAKPTPKCPHCGGQLKLYGFMLPTVIGFDTS
jgi:hypothetical protein